jgi:hypothetical protein
VSSGRWEAETLTAEQAILRAARRDKMEHRNMIGME